MTVGAVLVSVRPSIQIRSSSSEASGQNLPLAVQNLSKIMGRFGKKELGDHLDLAVNSLFIILVIVFEGTVLTFKWDDECSYIMESLLQSLKLKEIYVNP